MRSISLLFLSLLLTVATVAQSVKSPDEFLGYPLGTQFTRHHQVVDYYRYVASQLDNVTLEEYGKTNEGRLLQVAYVSSQQNIDRLETIRKANLSNAGIENGPKNDDIAIVWLSYNVHGNESSSTEASMKTLYELVSKKQAWLANTLVIIDPCINPDGRDRYVNWYKQVRSRPYNSTQAAKEHHEPWPGGRPNHYLFDLNRDWAWATQVETQQRLKIYNKWLPHIHVDFHEQGINEPYYFAPAAEPFHEVITNWQRDFQTQIGKNHAKYFDKEGWLYFTRERFDLFYPSYGDTYPTYLGAIGMTYEQAGHGRAGLGIINDEGIELTLIDRIAHHTTTGLSTVEISSKNAAKLNTEFRKFFATRNARYKSYVLRGNNDRLASVKELLDKHEIQYGYANGGRVSGFDYIKNTTGSMNTTSNDLVVSTNQPKGQMVKVLFEPQSKLVDSLTYDITAWGLPYAYGLQAIASQGQVNAQKKQVTAKKDIAAPNSYAYVSKWNSVKDAEFLGQLLQQGIKVRFTEVPFTAEGADYDRGSLIIVRGDNKHLGGFDKVVIDIANDLDRSITPVKSGFVDKGADFGSPNVKLVNNNRVAILSGDGVSSLSFGEIWHFFETQLHYPLTILDTSYASRIDLSQFDVLIMPNGWYGDFLEKDQLNGLKSWVRNGGKLIAIGNALKSFADKEGFQLKKKNGDNDESETNQLLSYAQQERDYIKELITGSVFKAKIDTTHPLAFGYEDHYFTLKLHGSAYQFLNSGYNVGYLGDNARPVSGFAGSNVVKKQENSLLFGEERIGSGSMIYMVDNPLFRSFWENGKLFLANAIFFTNNNKFRI
ncbi:M14 family metallopeptidase [Sungkyunkwania multivorans]|uniref:M14 family metallopeptidase n=1 Tax=Sungkyunkwania multivorans TaxID=1173618 RepID=A0ABW3CU10_9FLAO